MKTALLQKSPLTLLAAMASLSATLAVGAANYGADKPERTMSSSVQKSALRVRQDTGRNRSRTLHADQPEGHGGQCDHLRGDSDRIARVRPPRQNRKRRARVRQSGPVREGESFLRRHGRPRRQPDRQGPLQARRQGIHPGREQRPEPSARCTAGSRASTRKCGAPSRGRRRTARRW